MLQTIARWLLRALGVVPGSCLHLLLIEQEKGHQASLHLTEGGARRALLEYVQSFETDAHWPDEYREAKLAGDHSGMISAYFEEHPEEFFCIEECQLHY